MWDTEVDVNIELILINGRIHQNSTYWRHRADNEDQDVIICLAPRFTTYAAGPLKRSSAKLFSWTMNSCISNSSSKELQAS